MATLKDKKEEREARIQHALNCRFGEQCPIFHKYRKIALRQAKQIAKSYAE